MVDTKARRRRRTMQQQHRHDQLLHRGPQVLHHQGTRVLHNYKCRASLLHRGTQYNSAPSYYTEVPAYFTTKTVEYYTEVIIGKYYDFFL
jgi:hypothetical protein